MRTYRRTRRGKRGARIDLPRWWIELRDWRGIVRQFAGFTDREASAELGRKVARISELRAAGREPDGELRAFVETMPMKLRVRLAEWRILDAATVAAARPLDAMLVDWAESIRASDTTEKHVALVITRTRTLFRACGFRFWSDLRPEPVEQHLRALRNADRDAIARHLASMGDEIPGNVRAFWTSTVGRAGLSAKTSNHVLSSARSFCTWVVRRGYAAADPLRVLEPLNARADRRVRRRALSEDDLRSLIAKTHTGPTLGRVPGPARALAYALMAETGFRVRELVALRVSSFADLEGPAPTVSLPAHATKNRRDAVVPLRRTTAAAVARFLGGRGALESALGLPLAWRPTRALRLDLKRADLPYADESGRRFDAHSLRGMLATRLLASGASVPAAQKLMRHATSDMTVATYARVRGDREEREALEQMPDLLPTTLDEARATGTVGDECPSQCPFPVASHGHDWPREADENRTGAPWSAPGAWKVVEAAGIEPASRLP